MNLEDGWKRESGGTPFFIFAEFPANTEFPAIAAFLIKESSIRSFRFYFWEVSGLFLTGFLTGFSAVL
jgi:hypothetical protein